MKINELMTGTWVAVSSTCVGSGIDVLGKATATRKLKIGDGRLTEVTEYADVTETSQPFFSALKSENATFGGSAQAFSFKFRLAWGSSNFVCTNPNERNCMQLRARMKSVADVLSVGETTLHFIKPAKTSDGERLILIRQTDRVDDNSCMPLDLLVTTYVRG